MGRGHERCRILPRAKAIFQRTELSRPDSGTAQRGVQTQFRNFKKSEFKKNVHSNAGLQSRVARVRRTGAVDRSRFRSWGDLGNWLRPLPRASGARDPEQTLAKAEHRPPSRHSARAGARAGHSLETRGLLSQVPDRTPASVPRAHRPGQVVRVPPEEVGRARSSRVRHRNARILNLTF